MLDEKLGYAKGGGGTMATALTRAARDNRVPSLLVSAGAMMFLSERLGLPRRNASGSASRIGRMARKAGWGLTQNFSEATSQLAMLSPPPVSKSEIWAGRCVSGRRARHNPLAKRSRTIQARWRTRPANWQSRPRISSKRHPGSSSSRPAAMEEQPLLAGAIGLAIGVGIAAVLPKR